VANRSRDERRADALRRLETDANVWVATAGPDGSPHLVPLSLVWDGTRVLVATPTATPTVRNAVASGRARLALDSADDVVLIEAAAEVVDFESADEALTKPYVERVGWDPRDEPGTWSLILLTPRVVRAWNGVFEIAERTIMRDGAWIDAEPGRAAL
jgi:hypothetical protein